jgi:hypothetical protein
MLSPNTRVWTEDEIGAYIASRPAENLQPLKGAPRIRHERRKAAQSSAEE